MAFTDAGARRLIAYFRDCLVEDGGERQIIDVFGRDEGEHELFACPPERWLDPDLIELPAPQAERLIALLRMQRQERELLLGACLVCGPAGESGGRARAVRAPLLLYGAELVQKGGRYGLRAERDSLRLNPVVLEALNLTEPQLRTGGGELDLVRLQQALQAFERRGHAVKIAEFAPWRAGEPTRWSATGVFWVTMRSQLARSVAYELDALSGGQQTLSRPLRQLLGELSRPNRGVPAPVPETLPTRLTAAQERTLRNAAAETVSVVNGPPGTGKTYTIACQTVDRVLRGERVLLVCGNEHAADVARGKLAELFGAAEGLIVRAGRGDYRQQLIERLDKLLGGQAAPAQAEPPKALAERLHALAAEHRGKEKRFRRALGEAAEEGALARAGGVWAALRRWWLTLRLGSGPLLSARWDELQQSMREHQTLAREYLAALAQSRLEQLLSQRRRQLAALATALRSRASGQRESRFEALDWPVLTQAFPVWVVSAQALHRVLPLQSELFDLVILDEATQCNLPLALPALQRAARAVIVGDPKQLRHYSFLSRARQHTLAAKHEVTAAGVDLDYRDRSLLDYGLSAVRVAEAVVLLDEHFRSHPDLIAFSNRRFYGGRLKVLTRFKPDRAEPPLETVECPVRLSGDVNLAEIETVLARLSALVEQSRELPDHECPRIGVLAFFRSTALRLERELLDRFDLRTISRHDLRAGTPYAFQGEERDVMLLASGLYPGRAAAAWTYLNRPDVFNVAVTRARHRQIVFIAEGALAEGGGSLLAEYLREPPVRVSPAAVAGADADALRAQLVEVLESWGARCRRDFPFAGQSLDLLVLHGERSLAVDVIGAASPAGAAWDWERYRLLERAGLALFPIGEFAWRERRDEVLAALRTALGVSGAVSATDDARRFAALRWRLQELRDVELIAQLDALEANYRQALSWLERRFQPTELTYLRYRESVERLGQSALAELQGACLLEEGLRELTPEAVNATLRQEVQARVEDCRKAVAGLAALAEQLALLRTEESGLEDALAEVVRLAERVPRYGVRG